MRHELVAFDDADADAVLEWVRADELEAWAGLREPPGRDVFRRWHREPGVHPFSFRCDDRLCAYGEVWEDPEEAEAQVARVVVDPRRRGRGVGRAFVELLAREAVRRGYRAIWLRVLATNASALACYGNAGFVRATPDEEREFNVDQPREYVWMRYRGDGATGSDA